MSQQQQKQNIPVSELYWSLVAKADKKFSKIRDLPNYERNRYDAYFYKVFKVYTQLWKFQQENRQKLVEAGLKRWEIGDIASRIGQLYFGHYMRTSDASYLLESYIFYEAVLTREYFKEGIFQDLNLANKQLRFFARFLTVCLVLNRREMAYQLVSQLRKLVDECKRTFQETDFKEWKVVIQEIAKFHQADNVFMNVRPLRYSLVLDLHPDQIPNVVGVKRKLRLKDAILCSYHPNEVKFSELTIDTFRMLQCLEWEPSGSFYQSSTPFGAGTNIGHDGGLSGHISDPTLPPNPRKAVLYRPSITHFIAVLATVCEELASDGVLFIYLSASGTGARNTASTSSFPFCSGCDSATSSIEQSKGDYSGYHSGGLNLGVRGHGGLNIIYPCDLIPFTRRPLFLVIDSDNSKAFKALNRAEKGEPVAILLSPSSCPGSVDSSRQQNGSLFTSFLTAPLQAFLVFLGVPVSEAQLEEHNNAEKALSIFLNQWGVTLASSDTLHPVWAQVLGDPFLRRILLRFLFCRAVLALYEPTFNKKDYLPECVPCLPDAVLPITTLVQSAVLQIATIFGVTNKFILSEGVTLPEVMQTDEHIPSS